MSPLLEPSDESLLRETVRNHQEMVFRLAYRVLGNSNDAEDATQEVFIQEMRGATPLRSIRSPQS